MAGNEFGIIFRCSACSTELSTLERLESHIWSRHIRAFPYNCSICDYPALTPSSLQSHFELEHPAEPIQFKRKIADEMKMKEVLSSSHFVPSMLYEEDEPLYEANVPELDSQVLDHVQMDGVIIDEQGQPILDGVTEDNGDLIYMNIKGNPSHQDEHLQQHQSRHQHDHIQLMSQVEESSDSNADMNFVNAEQCQQIGDPDDFKYKGQMQEMPMDEGQDLIEEDGYVMYSGHDLLDEATYYVDEQGDTIYVTEDYPSSRMPSGNSLMRASKNRHIELVVNQVSRRKGRPSTMWQCPLCGKIVRYPSRIEEHRRTHTGEKPYECEHCGQKFTQKGALKCHMRNHSGERPYACTWECGKTFVSASAQRMHEKKHSGEKSYACMICNRLFSKKYHLLRHEKVLHQSTVLNVRGSESGLDAAGDSKMLLKPIVEDIVHEVRESKMIKDNGGMPVSTMVLMNS